MDFSRQLLVENYHHPHNSGKPEEFELHAKAANMSCGDEVDVYIQAKSAQQLGEIYFEIRGCALCIASGSILAQELSSQPIEQIKSFTQSDLEDILGDKLTYNRSRCALLPLEAIKSALALSTSD